MSTPEWPKHPDGRPMKIGEMSKEQRREQFKAAAQKVQRELNSPKVRAALERVLNKS